MWPFILTRTITLEKTIAASRSDVLKILHDPQQVLANNPMVVSVVQDNSEPSWYTVTERIPLVGSWATHTKFRTQWMQSMDGCDVEVHAALWTRLKNEMRVRELNAEEGSVLLHEQVVVQVKRFSSAWVSVLTQYFSGVVFIFSFHRVHHGQRPS